jgi:Zn-dependent protease with chaperone function
VDFYARQESARRATRWLVAAFAASVLCIVVAIDAVVVYIVSTSQPGASPRGAVIVTSILVVALVCGASLFKSLSLRSGGGSVARSLGGTRVERGTGDVALRRLHNVVEEMSIASGVAMPEVYVLENEDGINAFAAGHSPADAAIAVTRGAATRLKREELQAVVAHEFSHILNGDSRLNLRLLGLVYGLLVIAIVARIVLQHAPRTGRRDRGGGGGAIMLAALAVMVLGYFGVFFGRLIQAAVSRSRERLADASAVQFTRNPAGLTGALLKIAGAPAGSRLAAPEAEQVAHMLFAPGFQRLMSTHPPLEERLQALDRNFARAQLPALAAAAARDADQLREEDATLGARRQLVTSDADPVARIAAQSVAAAAAPTALAAAAHDAVHRIGSLDTDHVQYAERARLAIPEPLREFVDSADHARSLLLVLLASRVPEVRGRQREILVRAYGEEAATRVLGMEALAASLAPRLRLPAVQQLFPALRRTSRADREQLHDVVAALAGADAQIDVFECCLGLLMAASLRDELDAAAPHGGASLLQEEDAILTLFTVLAMQGNADPERARHAFEAGIGVVLPERRSQFAAVAAWPQALERALGRLAALRPFAKKVLIEGLARCVAHDGTMSIEEGELLRTVCSVLRCPLPPILTAAELGS